MAQPKISLSQAVVEFRGAKCPARKVKFSSMAIKLAKEEMNKLDRAIEMARSQASKAGWGSPACLAIMKTTAGPLARCRDLKDLLKELGK